MAAPVASGDFWPSGWSVHTRPYPRYLGAMGDSVPVLKMYRFDHPQQVQTCWICAPDDNAARQVVNERMRLLKLSPNMAVTFVAMPMREMKDGDRE